jgi:hypothetical protein
MLSGEGEKLKTNLERALKLHLKSSRIRVITPLDANACIVGILHRRPMHSAGMVFKSHAQLLTLTSWPPFKNCLTSNATSSARSPMCSRLPGRRL